ncbi:hypothetical protein J7S89_16395 [Acinetobacter baumannii]|uniref:Uncharacterized protein n=4 Tax=Acinetobacter baumannii TaxID=470 RepID=A0A0D8GFZ7_ACIBA|nr:MULTISPECIES: hypothetical protein [Acinetobacter]EMT95240.1 hypothetical protein ABNIH6_12007 [Acinetobacter baumannii ABNIH6]EMU17881.1 hypothetical protein ABNIH10_01453 [Acinetobacter baumannii ABNIH10]PXA49459.1 hypothetical protein DMB35_20635 [Acinetobacter baumannii A424]ACJ40399.2 hypothetical protein AB57_1379 [Acinetobacter baumannii AB0057]AJF81208.1 hypothetical protein ABA1_01310 [Acinetobacter baumannii]
MSVGSILHAEEYESTVCEKLNIAAYQIMLERQSGIKSLDLLEKLLIPLAQDKENVITNSRINNFFGHVSGLAYETPLYTKEDEKQKAATDFGLRIERICTKDKTALFAPPLFQTFEE